jgi:hypothetical protein
MSTETPVLIEQDYDDYIVRDSAWTRTDQPLGSSSSSTQTAERALRTARLLTPLLVAVAFVTPQVQTAVRRRFSAGRRSSSARLDYRWALDDWAYTEERGTREQIEALNALLALPAREGFSLDHPE